jgi:hypothetical protein
MVLHGRVIVYGFVELTVRMMTMMPRIVGRNGTRPQLDDIPCNGIDHPAEQGAFLRIKNHSEEEKVIGHFLVLWNCSFPNPNPWF